MAKANDKTDIWVYAHWAGMNAPKCIGVLSAHQAKGRKAFSFEYDAQWLHSEEQMLLDPDIGWYTGPQYPLAKENFGLFLDSMPDRWGRTLLKRRAVQAARTSQSPVPALYDIDYLLSVFDESRMGALRFKLNPDGPFLDNNPQYSIPPWSSVRKLQYAVDQLEKEEESEELQKWLNVLIAPGSSLGGARPKANILDEAAHPWIAKIPSKNDEIDKGAWEYLAYSLAIEAGINMSVSKMEKITGKYHVFFTRRFDRAQGERIHFASAMTMLGYNEEALKDYTPSYLEIAEFIQYSGADASVHLHQLWRRIAFSIAISNTDDHLKNHGFLLTQKGWELSPAYDINPSTDKKGLALNIDMDDNALDFDLLMSIGAYFQLSKAEMKKILDQVKKAVSGWPKKAEEMGISRFEREVMSSAFRWR
jgi:serine/threonine-protein kinase HipA